MCRKRGPQGREERETGRTGRRAKAKSLYRRRSNSGPPPPSSLPLGFYRRGGTWI